MFPFQQFLQCNSWNVQQLFVTPVFSKSLHHGKNGKNTIGLWHQNFFVSCLSFQSVTSSWFIDLSRRISLFIALFEKVVGKKNNNIFVIYRPLKVTVPLRQNTKLNSEDDAEFAPGSQ